jgi:hypothetical protein
MTEIELPGVPFHNALTGTLPGFVVGLCGHRVARSEWAAGYRVCERCTHDDYVRVEQALEWLAPVQLGGSLTYQRAQELLAEWEHRADLSGVEVQLILNRYPDPDDYETQVTKR